MVPRSSSGFFHAQKYPEQPNAPDDFFYWLPPHSGRVRGEVFNKRTTDSWP